MDVLEYINQIFLELDQQTVFIATALALILGFMLNLVFSLFIADYSYIKRMWFVFYGLTGYAFLYVNQLYHNERVFVAIYLCVFLMLCAFTFLIRVKKKKVKQAEKELINYIDNKIKEGENYAHAYMRASKPVSSINCVKQEEKSAELNFSHVKNVLERLSYYSLKESDKKQTRELEYALAECERGNDSPQMRSKVNDGLSALLKIMAKYGV